MDVPILGLRVGCVWCALFSLWCSDKILGVSDVFGMLCTGAVVLQRALPSLVLGCKTSVAGQSQAWAAPNSVLEVARNATEPAAGLGVLLWSRVTFSLTLPSLGLAAPGFLGISTLCGGQVPNPAVLPCTGRVLGAGARVK